MSRKRGAADVSTAESSNYMRQMSLRWELDIHPGRSLELDDAVRDELNGRLMRYDDRLGGVMLSYWDERIVTRKAQVLELIPYIRAVVTLNAIVFRPIVGTLLDGVVNEVRDDFLHLLVFGVFHVSIGRSRIRPDFKFVPDPGSGLCALQSSRDKSHRVVGGGRVRFTVAGVEASGGSALSQEIVKFTGAMEGEDTGSSDYLDGVYVSAGAGGGTAGGAAGAEDGDGDGDGIRADQGHKKKKKKRAKDGDHAEADAGAANGIVGGHHANGAAAQANAADAAEDEDEAAREKKRRKQEKKEKKARKQERKKAKEKSRQGADVEESDS